MEHIEPCPVDQEISKLTPHPELLHILERGITLGLHANAIDAELMSAASRVQSRPTVPNDTCRFRLYKSKRDVRTIQAPQAKETSGLDLLKYTSEENLVRIMETGECDISDSMFQNQPKTRKE